jgi:hypothetical protein
VPTYTLTRRRSATLSGADFAVGPAVTASYLQRFERRERAVQNCRSGTCRHPRAAALELCLLKTRGGTGSRLDVEQHACASSEAGISW